MESGRISNNGGWSTPNIHIMISDSRLNATVKSASIKQRNSQIPKNLLKPVAPKLYTVIPYQS